MNSWMRTRAGKLSLIAGLLLTGSGVGAAVVVAQTSSVTSYTGCLALSGGTVTLLAPGNSPLRPCGPGTVQIRLSGGDITSVTAGTGLTGGGTEGDVSLGIATSYQLPQTCTSGAIPSWNGTQWVCGSDTNTTYTAGLGLDLSSTNQFSVESGYRLPQGCQPGSVAKVSNGLWTCATDQVATSTLPAVFFTSYGPSNVGFGFLPGDNAMHPILSLAVPAGNYLVTAPVHITSPDTSISTVCVLEANGTTLFTSEIWDESETSNDLVLIAPTQLPTGGTLLIQCQAGPDARGVQVRAAIAASQVGTITVLPRQ